MRTSYFLHPTSYFLRRRGISLLEVLISIGIMAVGLISVMSLLPVGGIQAQKADIEQRKAETGLNIVREFKTRGMARLPTVNQLNESTDPNTYCPWRLFNGNEFFVSSGIHFRLRNGARTHSALLPQPPFCPWRSIR